MYVTTWCSSSSHCFKLANALTYLQYPYASENIIRWGKLIEPGKKSLVNNSYLYSLVAEGIRSNITPNQVRHRFGLSI